MNVYRNLEEIPNAKGSVATIGSFDGLHIGHNEILSKVKELAAKHHTQSTVITLYPHPRIVLGLESDGLMLITTLQEKIYLLDREGIDNLVILEFTRDFAGLSYECFVQDYLVSLLEVKAMVVGYNHHFGKGREGGFEMLQALGEKHGFEVYQVSRYAIDETKISSNTIRQLILEGRLDDANKYLLAPYFVSGDIEGGVLTPSDPAKILPPPGVYSAKIDLCEGRCAYVDDIYISANHQVVFPKEVQDFGGVRVEIRPHS